MLNLEEEDRSVLGVPSRLRPQATEPTPGSDNTVLILGGVAVVGIIGYILIKGRRGY